MQTFDIPCARCAEKRSAFEAEGFTVFGCDPHPSKQDMCVLKYDRPDAAPAAAPAAPAQGAALAAAKVEAAPLPRLVNVDTLNLRSTPSATSSSNVLVALHLGDELKITGPQQAGWWPVQLADDGEVGFVKAVLGDMGGVGVPSLRPAASAAREALVAEAVAQWKRFRFGQGKETVDPFFQFIGEMWKQIELPHDGRDDIPWSAAAISFMVRRAAQAHEGYRRFRFAASHSKYIHDAIRRAGDDGPAPFRGHRLFEHKPQVGDLVARSREDAITFEQAGASDSFKSHTDIVVAVHADEVLAIGGNVSNSVSITKYRKTGSGHLGEHGGVFAHLVNSA